MFEVKRGSWIMARNTINVEKFKKPIFNLDLLIPLSTESKAHCA
jgi:hypothetical protein